MITIVPGAINTDLPCALIGNILAVGALTASVPTVLGAISNMTGPQTFDYWQGASAPGRIVCNMTDPVTCDCYAIAAHDIGSKGATVEFQYRVTGTGAFTTWATLTPVNDDAIMVIAPPVSARFWAINIAAAPGGMPNIGVIYIGQRVVFPSPLTVPYVPFNMAPKVELTASTSLGGQLLGARVARKGRGTSLPFLPLDGAWCMANLPAFQSGYDLGVPFFFAACPVQYPDDLAYCWRADGAGELRPAWQSGGLWAAVRLEVDAYGA